jgi:hypothetical protein
MASSTVPVIKGVVCCAVLILFWPVSSENDCDRKTMATVSSDNGRIINLLEQTPVHSPNAADERIGGLAPTPFAPKF